MLNHCDYFTNIGPNLAKKIPAATTSYHCSLTGNFITSVFLQPATQQEILEIVNSLRLGTAAGWDMIPMCAVKDSMDLWGNNSSSNKYLSCPF